jgi:hypothetical protein
MELKELSKPLSIADIDFRVQSINKGKYATILAYKDARVDMCRLDDVCGIDGWKRDYKEIGGLLFGGVAIWSDRLKEWIWKWDVGTESTTEKEKGLASDSFKRACFNLGIGRELYDYPLISIKLNDNECSEQNGRMKQSYGLRLKDWVWFSQFDPNNKLNYLACKDEKGNKRFEWGTYRDDKK